MPRAIAELCEAELRQGGGSALFGNGRFDRMPRRPEFVVLAAARLRVGGHRNGETSGGLGPDLFEGALSALNSIG